MNEDAIFDLADKIFGERNYSRGRVKALYEAAFGRGVSEGARMVRESFQKAAARPSTNQNGQGSPNEYPQAAEVCAELYQVIGSLARDLGVFDQAHVVKALDNAAQHTMIHDDVLPFPSFNRQNIDVCPKPFKVTRRSVTSVTVSFRSTMETSEFEKLMLRKMITKDQNGESSE